MIDLPEDPVLVDCRCGGGWMMTGACIYCGCSGYETVERELAEKHGVPYDEYKEWRFRD